MESSILKWFGKQECLSCVKGGRFVWLVEFVWSFKLGLP